MNTRQVIEQIATLCSLDALENKTLLYAALNRALDDVGLRHPERVVEVISHALPIPAYAGSEPVTVSEHPLRIEGNGIYAIALEVSGEGSVAISVNGTLAETYTVTDGSSLTLTINTSQLLSGVTRGRVSLILTGEPCMQLLSVALYDVDCKRIINYDNYYRYSASQFSRRFLAFTGKLFKNGREFANHGDTVLLDRGEVAIRFEADGLYGIEYLALPVPAFSEKEDDELILRPDTLPLVLLLAAYYTALEDENPAASAFLERCEAAERAMRHEGDETVDDVYGW